MHLLRWPLTAILDHMQNSELTARERATVRVAMAYALDCPFDGEVTYTHGVVHYYR